MNKITSTSNSMIQDLIKLEKKSERETKKLFLIEGMDLINDAYKNGVVKQILSVDEGFSLDGVEVTHITDNVMKRLSKMKSPSKQIAVCNFIEVKDISSDKVIYLDGIQDPGNVGTIIRTASSFGFKDIVLAPKCADIYNEKTIRATKGAIFNINIIRKDINDIKDDFKIISTTLDSESISLQDLKINDKSIIVFGSEGQGVSREIIEASDIKVKIDISTNDSLNVGVATGIVLEKVRWL